MANEDFDLTQKTLLGLLGQNLFSLPFSPDLNTDWESVLDESVAQSVLILAFKNYRDFPLDGQLADRVQKAIRMKTIMNLNCFKNHTYLTKLMEENHISYCMIKGAASAHYYPDPLLRNMGDVDFYVSPCDIEKATNVLLEAGFCKKEGNHQYHTGFQKGKSIFEMHFEPIAVPGGDIGSIFREYWKDIYETSAIVRNGLAEFRMPSLFHHGFILLTHLYSHMLSEGVGLRHVCDWALFVNSLSAKEFEDIFRDKLKRVGLWNLAQTICLAAVECMGMPYQDWMGDDRETARALLLDFMKGGNFGHKNRQRGYEGFFISNRGVDGVQKNRVFQLFFSMNRLVDGYWSFAKKCPLLYPVGWIYFTIRFFCRRISGKRKISVWNSYVEGGKRKELYKKLNLLEPEQ